MSRVRHALERLARRPPRHVVGRLGQLARARLERLGGAGRGTPVSGRRLLRALDRAGVRDADDFLERFQRRAESAALPVFREPPRARAALASGWPGLEERAVARAESIAAGRFDLLGYRELDFGDPIDWHLDPISGRRAPRVHWSRVPYLDREIVGDHKVVWELNRHQYLLWLGQAYWLTSEDRWAALFAEHVDAWMSSNPPKLGINWASSLEVAFRSISWLWALHFFARSEHLTAERFTRLSACLRAHGRHIERYISTYFSPNTHLTGEALGLVYLGSLLPELPEAGRWRSKGRGWLLDALEFQIRPDGGYFEQSTHYHRYTVDFYLHLLLLSRVRGETPPAGLEDRLVAMVDHLVAVTRPDRHIPLIGDDDGGRLAFLDERPVADVRSTILAAAVMLERPDWAAFAGRPSEELVWLLGPDAVPALEGMRRAAPPVPSCALRDTGFFVMRSGWEPDADYAIVRCGPHGGLSGGHSHADALSVELVIGGEPLLVDAGTASYVDLSVRDRFRSTAAHNTVAVAGRSSCEPGGPFGWRSHARSELHEWVVSPTFAFFEGSHDGYERLEAGLRHRRAVLWIPGEYWVIRDLVTGFGRLPAEARATYQFAPGLGVRQVGQAAVEASAPDGRPLARLVSLLGSEWEEAPGAVSPAYGEVRAAEARTLAGAPAGRGALEIVTLVSRAPLGVTPLETEGGWAWRVGERDLLTFGYGEPVRVRAHGGVVETDFRCVWHRPGPEGAPGSLLAVGGRRLGLEPRAPLELPAAVRYVSLQKGKEPEIVSAGESGEGKRAPHDAVSSWWHGPRNGGGAGEDG